MDSEQATLRPALPGAMLLAAGAFGAGLSWNGPLPSLAASGAAACAGAALLWRALRRLRARQAPPPLEVPPGLPRSQQELSTHALLLESRLEHAPVALYAVSPQQQVTALNTSARRLLAPGRVSDAPAVCAMLAALAAGRRQVVQYETEAGAERALAACSTVTVDGVPQQLVALMPMESELEAESMRAWQKLVHVLTHEMMNSLTPVASLSQTTREMLRGGGLSPPLELEVDTALDAIARRAASLTQFVSGYRSLASVPEAQAQRIVVAELFARLRALFGAVAFNVEPPSVELFADPGQLEQALVNLLRNAAEATEGHSAPRIEVTARLTRGGRLRIEVSDNGPGVPDALASSLFTPFFTTKARGSGIGLAMARQLVHRNGGALRYARSVGPGARFLLTF